MRWWGISYGDRLANTAIRGVYPEYGLIRNEVPSEGRWISAEDMLERRRDERVREIGLRRALGARPGCTSRRSSSPRPWR